MMVRGVLYVLGGVLHSAAGLPALDHALAKTNVGAQLAQELSIFWVFMGASMVTFGGVQLTRGLRMRKKDRSGSVMALWVAACLILYDVAATIWIREFEPHFLAFVLVGLLMVFAALPGRKAATR